MVLRRMLISAITLLCFGAAGAALRARTPPQRLVFQSKAGDIVFNHLAHVKRQKGTCSGCHNRLWPQSSGIPLKSSSGCKDCHRAEGKAFDMKGNCAKCHAPKGGL